MELPEESASPPKKNIYIMGMSLRFFIGEPAFYIKRALVLKQTSLRSMQMSVGFIWCECVFLLFLRNNRRYALIFLANKYIIRHYEIKDIFIHQRRTVRIFRDGIL